MQFLVKEYSRAILMAKCRMPELKESPMNLMKKYILIFSIILTSLTYGASSPQTGVTPNAKVESIASTPTEEKNLASISDLKVEIKLLKAQNKLIRDYQGSMADTVYWALGIISGVFAILMSYSIFTNFKFYEQDKARLKSELDSVISTFKSELLVKFEQDKSDLEKSFDSRNEANMRIVLDQGTESRTRVDAIRTELQAKLDETINKIVAHDAHFSLLTTKNHRAEYELRTVEEMVWELRDIPDCIILTQCQGIRASKDGSVDFAMNSVLKRMKETIQKHYLDENRPLKPNLVKRIEEALAVLGDNHMQTVQEIRQQVEIASNVAGQHPLGAADVGDLP